MPRSVCVSNLFGFSAALITVLGSVLAFMDSYEQAFTISTLRFLIICILVVITVTFVGGSISIVYIRLLKWVLQHLHTTEDHRWVIALGITALCDVFLDEWNMTPFIVLSTLSMIMICVVAAGWDCDRSGMTEGLLIGFGKLFLVHLTWFQLLPSIICATVLGLAIASKLTECVGGLAGNTPDSSSSDSNEVAGNTLHVGSSSSTCPAAEV